MNEIMRGKKWISDSTVGRAAESFEAAREDAACGNKTMEVIFILDRSGSMHGQEEDIINGFNRMIEEQRAKGYDARISTILFNSAGKSLHYRLPVKDVAPLTRKDYAVGGSTALLDMLGRVLSHYRVLLYDAEGAAPPHKALVVIMTDGRENASKYFNAAQIRGLIAELETEFGWEFVFIGADIDAISAAAEIGVGRRKAYQFFKTSDSFHGGMSAVGDMMFRIADQGEKLTDEDWDALHRAFDEKKKK